MIDRPQITNIRLESDGVFASIYCSNCGFVFENYLTTVGGVTIGQCACPCCHGQHTIWPEDFLGALDRLFPTLNQEEQISLTEEATRITESWYQVSPMDTLLDFLGVNLGEGPERELMPIVLQGLYQARAETIHETRNET